MKAKALPVLCVVLLAAIAVPSSGQERSLCVKMQAAARTLKKHHIERPQFNGNWIPQYVETLVGLMDPRGTILSLEDQAALHTMQKEIENSLQHGDCKWAVTITELYRKRINQSRQSIDSLLKAPLGYDRYSYRLRHEADMTRKKKAELVATTQEVLAEEIIYRALLQSEREGVTFSVEWFKKREPELRDQVRKRELRKLDHGTDPKLFVQRTEELIIKAIAQSLDPHSDYFSENEMTHFIGSLDRQEQSFGITFMEDQLGKLKVDQVVPGGPAWISNGIHPGDELIALENAGGQFEVADYDFDEIMEQVFESEYAAATFTFLKQDRRTLTIVLEKALVQNVDNTVSSFIIRKDGLQIGHIALPSFYFSFSNEDGQGCANDIAAEIIKLKKEKIDGLILDLRFNSGGSVFEAQELAGIFIDFGPIGIIESETQTDVLKDLNRGTAYDGALIVLVNGASASASELVASSLQQYNRALIVGTNTYGKATSQILLPNEYSASVSSNLGYLKITNGRIYAIDGNSYQQRGISPDVLLPDLTEVLVPKENMFPHASKHQRIEKKTYFSRLLDLPCDSLLARSRARSSQSSQMQTVAQLQNLFRTSEKLRIDEFTTVYNNISRKFELFETTPKLDSLDVIIPSFDRNMLAMDAFRQHHLEILRSQIAGSFYIAEACHIMTDLISFMKK